MHSRKRGITPESQDWWRKKEIRVRLFFMYMPHMKFQDSSISGSRVSQQYYGQTDGRTDRPKPIFPLNFSEVGGIMKPQRQYCLGTASNNYSGVGMGVKPV